MNLPFPFVAATWKRIIEQADARNVKQGGEIIVGVGPENRKNRLILVAPDGSRWSVTIGTDGTLSTTRV